MFFVPYILFFNDKISLTISYGLICILLSMIFDCLIFLLMIGIPFISKKFCGYTILVIQYGGFLLIIGLGAYLFIECLANPLLLWNISNWIQSYYMILFPILCWFCSWDLLQLQEWAKRVTSKVIITYRHLQNQHIVIKETNSAIVHIF